jgi:hypothetical protein
VPTVQPYRAGAIRTHQPLELLLGRDAVPLCAWLKGHAGVTVICRDRVGAYADGARNGALQAIQVADRYHLLQNLGQAVERCARQHRACLRPPDRDPPQADPLPTSAQWLASRSPIEMRFAALWALHDVEGPTRGQMRLNHPQVGELNLDWDAYPIPGNPGPALLVCTAAEGSPDAERLQLLANLLDIR